MGALDGLHARGHDEVFDVFIQHICCYAGRGPVARLLREGGYSVVSGGGDGCGSWPGGLEGGLLDWLAVFEVSGRGDIPEGVGPSACRR